MNRFARWRINRKVPAGFRIDVVAEQADEWSTTHRYSVTPVTEEALQSIVFNGNTRRHHDECDYTLPIKSYVWANYVGISTYDAMKYDLKPGDVVISRTTNAGEKQAARYAVSAIRELQRYAEVQVGLKTGRGVQSFGDLREVEA